MGARITTITSDRLVTMALQLASISNAVYEAGFREEASALAVAAKGVSDAGRSLEAKLETYAAKLMSDEVTP